VWTRIHEDAPLRHPNRYSSGAEVGIKNFNDFIGKLSFLPGGPPKVFIRGHDHHTGNFKRYEKYDKCAVLTINAFTVNRRPVWGEPRERALALLRWDPADGGQMTLFRWKPDEKQA